MAVSTRTGFARWILIRAACNDYHRPFPPRNAQSEGPNRRSSVTIYDPNRTRLWTGCRSPHAGAPQPARQNRRDRRIAGVSVRQPLVDTSPTASTSRSSRPICSSSPIRGRWSTARTGSIRLSAHDSIRTTQNGGVQLSSKVPPSCAFSLALGASLTLSSMSSTTKRPRATAHWPKT